MALTPEIKKLAQQALAIRNSEVPLHRAIDILATDNGDIPAVMRRYRDISEPDLRRALHYCAELLRAVEREAGLTPAWEAALQPPPAKAAESSGPAADAATKKST